MNREERNKSFNYQWQVFSKAFIIANPICRYCDNPTYATGHTQQANDYLKANGHNLLDSAFYVPVCRSCNALMKNRQGV